MNYYKQGDAANADKIKAAFEKLGYEKVNVIHIGDYANERLFFFTENGKVRSTLKDCGIANIIKTHPDYKELELPVKPNFKVGDWVVFNNSHNSIYQISEIRDFHYTLIHTHGGSMPLSFSQEELIRPWTIEDAKDGDVLMTTLIRNCPFIYRKTGHNNDLAYYYAGVDGNGNFCEGCLKRTLFHFGSVANVAPATKEQRDLLFKKMKEAGYTWDADKKELRNIQQYNIVNFKPKQWVLVRDDDEWEWALTRFGYLSNGSASLFVCINGASFQQCIPYEGNEKLLGTTDPCDERFINW